MKKKIVFAVLLALILATMVYAQTQYWYLLKGEEAYVICPTTLHVNQLAPNAVLLTCADSGIDIERVYVPHVKD